MTEGPPWVLLPGFSQTPSVWATTAHHLNRFRVPAIPAGCDFRTAAARLAASHRGRWAGYSMGGRIALQVALDHPDRVDHLVMISATPGIRDPARRAERRRADEELAVRIEGAGVEAFFDEWVARPLFAGVSPTELRKHRLTSPSALADQLRRLGQGDQSPLWGRLGELEMPVTIVAGGRDSAYTGVATEMAGLIAGARLEIVSDAGHALLQERPAELATILLSVG